MWPFSGRLKLSREDIGDEKELDCLEEAVDDYARGAYDNLQYIETIFEAVTGRPELIGLRPSCVAGSAR